MTIRSMPPNKKWYDNYDKIFKKDKDEKEKEKDREEAAEKGLRTNGEEI